jgi:SAM-dependent methyltransferase
MERRENWSDLSSDLKQQTVEAAAKGLPFPDNYFDLIVNIGSVYAYAIADEARVLKPGGEIRVSGFGGQALDMWYVAYYLQAYEGMPYEQVEKKLSGFEQAIEDNDGWRPNEYAALEEKSIETLTFEEKKIVIEALVARYEEVAGVPMEIRITDSESPEPKGYIVHKKLA